MQARNDLAEKGCPMLFGRRKRRIEKLLVVEDEPLVAFDNEHFLTDAGYQVVATVDRVSDAVSEIASGRSLDLVLVDITLADGSGLDVARAAFARAIPALFVSGQCPAEAQAFASGCLAKPYAQRDLLAAIQAVEAVAEGRTPKRLPPGLRLFERAE
jgi:DNA-binding response OmpR family regulator